MATVGRFIAALRPARTVPALQRSLAQPLTKESSVYRQLPFLRRYGDAATKYTHEYYENVSGFMRVLYTSFFYIPSW